jgi:hypothetical protein
MGFEGPQQQEINREESLEAQDAFQDIYESQLQKLRKTNKEFDYDGNPVSEGWHEEQAKKNTLSILAMRIRMQQMESK